MNKEYEDDVSIHSTHSSDREREIEYWKNKKKEEEGGGKDGEEEEEKKEEKEKEMTVEDLLAARLRAENPPKRVPRAYKRKETETETKEKKKVRQRKPTEKRPKFRRVPNPNATGPHADGYEENGRFTFRGFDHSREVMPLQGVDQKDFKAQLHPTIAAYVKDTPATEVHRTMEWVTREEYCTVLRESFKALGYRISMSDREYERGLATADGNDRLLQTHRYYHYARWLPFVDPRTFEYLPNYFVSQHGLVKHPPGPDGLCLLSYGTIAGHMKKNPHIKIYTPISDKDALQQTINRHTYQMKYVYFMSALKNAQSNGFPVTDFIPLYRPHGTPVEGYRINNFCHIINRAGKTIKRKDNCTRIKNIKYSNKLMWEASITRSSAYPPKPPNLQAQILQVMDKTHRGELKPIIPPCTSTSSLT